MPLIRILFIITSLLLLFQEVGLAQRASNLRQKIIALRSDTITLDTLSIVPGSLRIALTSGQPVTDTTFFKLLPAEGKLVFDRKAAAAAAAAADTSAAANNLKTVDLRLSTVDSIKVSYRTFPILFTQEYRRRDRGVIEQTFGGLYNPFAYDERDKGQQFFKTEGLQSNGNISRGVSFGNNQDAVVSSSFNLQLSGKLSDDVEILAAITDNNIPVQPEGNTQQIQDFDKVFIQLSRNKSKLIAGDFELRRPDSYFMNYFKKAQGGIITTEYQPFDKKDQVMRTGVSGAISKGKFARNAFNGIEANQGPYKLTGNDNETFIIVLAGTEKVFIDGQQLTRGEQFDYVIDYNTAEVRFTPKQPITKDKRITVEFQYSDKNYSRTMFTINQEYEDARWKVKANIFSEQDAKNQPLLQELDNEQKVFLASIGDSVQQAFFPNIDSVAFNSSEVLYAKIDSASYTFYRYTTDSTVTVCRLGFSFVGANKGNYVPVASGANGRVFQWLEPVNGIPQGSYEPVTLLITPKKQQLVTLGADYKLSARNKIFIEGALSNNDINLYSKFDKNNDVGLAIAGGMENTWRLSADSVKGWNLTSSVRFEHVNRLFKPVEPYRPAEFTRDWNLAAAPEPQDENMAGIALSLTKPQQQVGYQFRTFLRGNAYRGYMNTANVNVGVAKFRLTSTGSLLISNSDAINTAFLRSQSELSRPLGKVVVGVRYEQERNRIADAVSDSVRLNSFSFDMGKFFLASSDTAKIRYKFDVSRRYDYGVRGNRFKRTTEADEASGQIEFAGNPNSRLTLSGNYRTLKISDSLLTAVKPEESILTRVEYNASIKKGFITLNVFYEAGSGQELKKEYAFLEVAPGTGVYTYAGDYNGNGVKDLDEFEIAAFADQANYVKIFLPTNEYVRTRTNQFNQVLVISPAAIVKKREGFGKFISRFSNQTSYRTDNKTLQEDILKALNPFESDIASDILIATNSAFRNTLSFNRSSTVFATDVTWLDNRNKSILTNGFESRELNNLVTNIRWNITKVYSINLAAENGIKSSRSEFFKSRDFRLQQNSIEPKFGFQRGVSFRTTVNYKYSMKENTLGETNELSEQHTLGLEIKYSSVKQGVITAKVNVIEIDYNAPENTPLAYEVLEGLRVGRNFTWGAGIQRTLSNSIQVNLNYEGRKPEGTKVIHTGSVQARAFF